MIALFWLFLALSVSPFKSKNGLAAENAALRHQLIVLQRRVRSRIELTNGDRLFLVTLYRWFPSVLKAITIVRPETLVRWHRAGFRRYWRWKSRSLGGRPKAASGLGGWVLLLGRSAACAVCSRSNQAVRYLHNTYVYSRGVDGACARRVRGTRTARIEQSTPVKTPNDSGIGCGKPGDRRTAQGPAQIHFRAYVARDLGSQQSLFHSRRGLWVQSVSWGPGVCIVSLRSHHGHLRGDVGFVDVLSPLSTPLRHVRRGRRNWSHRRRLSFSQRLHRRSVPRRVDRVVQRRRMGMRQAAHTGASHREGPARKDFRT